MAAKNDILILAALKSEAAPLIRHFGLRQFETKPYRIHRNGRLLLVESGPGRIAVRGALDDVFSRYRIAKAVNIGTAGCNDPQVAIGTLIAVQGGPQGLRRLPILSVDHPLRELDTDQSTLVDMEAEEFLARAGEKLPRSDIHVLKVVSDHLDDAIPKKAFVDEIMSRALPAWDGLVDELPGKIRRVLEESSGVNLTVDDCRAIQRCALFHRFSYQEIKIFVDIAVDFRIWDLPGISTRLKQKFPSRKAAFGEIRRQWDEAKSTVTSYEGFESRRASDRQKTLITVDRELPGFGRCPVASPKTRCCNLLTLDAVEGCGYDCSYCSIRYFYDSESVGFNRNFLDKLQDIDLDPERYYHIGTGQSSDSLMWGNRNGILEGLLDFAKTNPRVILEFKTKSDNVAYLLDQRIPRNVITTWSLNPQTIIENEEHLSASLDRRISAARAIADQGKLVGFHFHPMILYDRWQEDYTEIIKRLLSDFASEEVAMVSFGTLTFIKPVIKKMRESPARSRILQMPLVEAGGKLSYPIESKREMFRLAYENFAPWHDSVFFYLCMEDASLWPDVFGRNYESNEDFEIDMIQSYVKKIEG